VSVVTYAVPSTVEENSAPLDESTAPQGIQDAARRALLRITARQNTGVSSTTVGDQEVSGTIAVRDGDNNVDALAAVGRDFVRIAEHHAEAAGGGAERKPHGPRA